MVRKEARAAEEALPPSVDVEVEDVIRIVPGNTLTVSQVSHFWSKAWFWNVHDLQVHGGPVSSSKLMPLLKLLL